MPKRNETLTFNVAFAGKDEGTATTTIVDTSYPMTYKTRWSSNSSGSNTITSTNEGTAAYLIIETDNVTDGTVLKVLLTATGSGTNNASAADFSDFVASQNVTINSNKAYIKLTPINDSLTEGVETVLATLVTSTGATLSTVSLNINDTSQTPAPTYTLGWYSSATATTTITSVNEGGTAWFDVKTTNVANGTILTVKLSGTGVNSADLSDGILQRDVTINNGSGRVGFTFANDLVTEGVETVKGTLYNGSTSVGSTNITVNDTSTAPVPTYTLTASATSVNEGGSITFTLKTTNVSNGTNVAFNITGVSVADISLSSLSGNFNIQNGSATLTFSIIADNLTEGTETLTLTLTGKGVSRSVTINDTSLTKVESFTTYMRLEGNWNSFDHSDDPQQEEWCIVAYTAGNIYVAKGKNGSFSLQGARGSIGNRNIVLDGFSFTINGWYGWRQNYWAPSGHQWEGYVIWTWGTPCIQFSSWSGTIPSVIYAKLGDMKFVFTRTDNVNGNLVYTDARDSNNYNPGAKYIGINTPLTFSLNPIA